MPYSPIPDTEEKESASLDLALLDSYVGQSASGASKKQKKKQRSKGRLEPPVPPSELPELLLVEDNPAILMFEALWLRSVGYNVHTACDSASAVAQLQRHCYAVVLLDINIPGGSGLSVIRQFRQWENIHRCATTAVRAAAVSLLFSESVNHGKWCAFCLHTSIHLILTQKS